MKLHHSKYDDTLTWRRGRSLPGRVAGLAVALGGFAAGLSPFWADRWLPRDRAPWPWLLVIGGAFTVFGLMLATERQGWQLNPRSRTVTTWWGLLMPWWRRVRSFQDAAAVLITPKQSGSMQLGGYSTVYAVQLPCERSVVTLVTHARREAAEQDAEVIARATDLPVVQLESGSQ